jgi:hypothetical protein
MVKRKRKLTWTKVFWVSVGKALLSPFKFLWWLSRQSYKGLRILLAKIKEAKTKAVIEAKRPKVTAKYERFSIEDALSGSFDDFERRLVNSDSTIGLILGARGSGKSAIGMRLLENMKAMTKKSCFAMGFNKESLPDWIKVVEGIDGLNNDSFVLIDEGGILFSSRKSMSDANKLLSDLLLIARHKNLSVMFISQNSANLEINAIRQADYLILKPSSLLQKDFERKKIKEIYDEVEHGFDKLKNRTGITYVYSTEFRGFITNSLPGFWSQKVSKSFR